VQQLDPDLSSLTIPPQGVGGFDACWYPVALSEELGEEAAMGADLLGGRVAVWRSADGMAHVQTAECAHLGADLSTGEVVGATIQCAFHHWCYDAGGRCVSPRPRDEVTGSRRRIFSYPTTEHLGIVWAFNGDNAAYDVPTVGGIDHGRFWWKARRLESFPGDPYVFLTNVFDIQHFSSLHGLDTPEDAEGIEGLELRAEPHRLWYQARLFGSMTSTHRVWGTNVFEQLQQAEDGSVWMAGLLALTPVRGGHYQTFAVQLLPRLEGESGHADACGRFDEQWEAAAPIFEDDRPVLETIVFAARNLEPTDALLARFLAYVRAHPRADPAAAWRLG
jgi:nitrite reductase/ring-hydroxylating ferredoxin subunit